MPTFTGYEPNHPIGNLIGKGPGNAPSTTSAPSQQLVQEDSLGRDLSNLLDAELSSLLEDIDDVFDRPILEPLTDSHVVPSGPKGFAEAHLSLIHI